MVDPRPGFTQSSAVHTVVAAAGEETATEAVAAGLSEREVAVLREAGRGFTISQVAESALEVGVSGAPDDVGVIAAAP